VGQLPKRRAYFGDNGVKWRALPVDFPAWDAVYRFFRRWREQDLVTVLHDRLRRVCRVAAGRSPEPITYSDTGYWLLLLPAWLVSCAYGERIFTAMINGATGDLAGEWRYSWAKICSPIAGLALALAAIILLHAR
jgi:transposase